MDTYQPADFWEKAHAAAPADDINLGLGIHYVGGGVALRDAAALYKLRKLNLGRVLRKKRLPTRPKIFELGSGGGFWVEFFQQFEPQKFVGSDLSLTAVQRLSAKYRYCDFVHMNPEMNPWQEVAEAGPFDLCMAIDVLYHITDDTGWNDTLLHLCRNVTAGGLLLIADYFYERLVDRPSQVHVKFRKMSQYLSILDKENFAIEEIQPIFYLLNRTITGPFRDHTRFMSPVLRFAVSNPIALKLVTRTDSIITKFARPMNPSCTTRFLLARRVS
jgi:hypothetical protein